MTAASGRPASTGRHGAVLPMVLVLLVGLAACSSTTAGSDQLDSSLPPAEAAVDGLLENPGDEGSGEVLEESLTDPRGRLLFCRSEGSLVSIVAYYPSHETEETVATVDLSEDDASWISGCAGPGSHVGVNTVAMRASFNPDFDHVAVSRRSDLYAGSHAGVVDLRTGAFTDLSGLPTDDTGSFATTTVVDGKPVFDGNGDLVWERRVDQTDQLVRTAIDGGGQPRPLVPGEPYVRSFSSDGLVWTDLSVPNSYVGQDLLLLSPDRSLIAVSPSRPGNTLSNRAAVCELPPTDWINHNFVYIVSSSRPGEGRCGLDQSAHGRTSIVLGWVDDATVVTSELFAYAVTAGPDGPVLGEPTSVIPGSDRRAIGLALSPDGSEMLLIADHVYWTVPAAGGDPVELMPADRGVFLGWE